MKKLSAAAINALIEALTHIYWTKKKLRRFIYTTIENKAIISTIDWDGNYKYKSVEELVDRMVKRIDIYNDDLLLLIDTTMRMDNFDHLKKLDDSEAKIAKAKESVNALRKVAHGYFKLKKEKEHIEELREKSREIQTIKIELQDNINLLRTKFYSIMAESEQKRGFSFEKFLNELFILFDLDPKKSFKNTGEQIDGAFTHENTDYLLEAKWQKIPCNQEDIGAFKTKVDSKLKTTLGLFISYNGFSQDSLEACKYHPSKSVILMDGADLMAVLEERIDLKDLIYRKRRKAAETGQIYVPFTELNK